VRAYIYYRQELESVTLKLHLQVCRSCERATDTYQQSAAAAGPAAATHARPHVHPRAQSCDEHRVTAAQTNMQQLQQLQLPASLFISRYFFYSPTPLLHSYVRRIF